MSSIAQEVILSQNDVAKIQCSHDHNARTFPSGLAFLTLLVTLASPTIAVAQDVAQTAGSATWVAVESDAPAETAVVPAAFNAEAGADTAAAQQETRVNKESVASELAAAEAATELSEEIKAEIKERLRKATEWLDGAAASAKRQAEIEARLPRVPGDLDAARQRLAEFTDIEFQAMPTGKSVAELESQLASLRQQVETEENLYKQRESELEGRTTRLTTLTKEAAELEQHIAELRGQVAAAKAGDPNGRALRTELQARLQLRQQELVTSKLERRRLEEIAELLPLQRDLAKRTWTNRQKMLSRWQTAIDGWRKEESKRQAEAARRMVEDSHPALKSLAEENALIAERRMTTAAEIQRLTETIKRLGKLTKQLDQDFSELKDRVEHAGTTSTTGLLLRKKRSELPGTVEFTQRAHFVQTTMPAAHLQLLEWKRQRREVDDPEEAAKAIYKSLDESFANANQTQVLQVLTRVLSDRRELLDKAIPDQDTLLQDLNELELVNQQTLEQVTEFRQYLNQRVLWIRSTDIISINDLREAQDGLATILSPTRWGETLQVGGAAMLRRPAVAFGLLAVVILLVIFRARMHAFQARLFDPPPPGEPTVYRKHVAAFGISLLLSARWPVLLMAIGYRLKIAANDSSWTESVGTALITSVGFLWGCELIRELCRAKAVGERLFGWPEKATAAVRYTLELTVLLGTPLFTMLQLTQYGEVDQMQSLQRILFIAILGLIGVQLARLTRPRGVLLRCIHETAPASLVARSRYAIWFAVTAAPLAFVVLSMTGYHFSAYQLSGHLAQTAAALLAIIIVHAVALSWLNVLGNNRSLRESALTEQVDASTPASETDQRQISGDADEEARPPESPRDATVDTELRDLLRYACLLLLVVGGWFIWSEVLPALRVFDHVVLWQNIEKVPETIVDGSGNESIRLIDHTVPTTLTDVVMAVLICIATMVVGRRIPGVVEWTVLEHLPMENGGRQAIAIIIRYVATVVGLLLACNVIRLSWSSVQWLAAAMTVGLGFGLQEIFANLVSGLIILVERPIRVGDIVSVGDVTGTVSRMQMRATTVTDYDRRELIVPNKKFITDNVINWTLSDPISRVVLPVGVAYGTNVSQVREIMLRIARRCPFVLDEPAPNTLFKGFGDSTLNVQLMVFIPQRSIYIDVVNELNTAIAREFAAANIEIAFPQMDLHVKNEQFVKDLVKRPTKRTAA